MWRERIDRWIADVHLGEPATGDDVEVLLRNFGGSLPGALVDMLLEFNGLADEYGTDVIWSAQQILRTNASFRRDPSFAELYAPFDGLIFFGDNGGGDQFAFGVGSVKSSVFVWDHETDERFVVADSFDDYVFRSLEAGGGDWYR